MIIPRSFLPTSLGGGETNLHSCYQEYDGFVISASIDNRLYMRLHQTFFEGLIVNYSNLERAHDLGVVDRSTSEALDLT